MSTAPAAGLRLQFCTDPGEFLAAAGRLPARRPGGKHGHGHRGAPTAGAAGCRFGLAYREFPSLLSGELPDLPVKEDGDGHQVGPRPEPRSAPTTSRPWRADAQVVQDPGHDRSPDVSGSRH